MTTFDTINFLLFDKSKKDLDNELLEEFNEFVTIKTFSFYDKGKYVNYINDTLNCYSNLFLSKEDRFKFFDNIIPKLKKRKIDYFKRKKKDDKSEDSIMKKIPEFYSHREISILENFL